MQEIRKVRRDKKAYMQDVPEAAHRDSTSTDSVKSVVKISEYYRLQSNVSNERVTVKNKNLNSYGL